MQPAPGANGFRQPTSVSMPSGFNAPSMPPPPPPGLEQIQGPSHSPVSMVRPMHPPPPSLGQHGPRPSGPFTGPPGLPTLGDGMRANLCPPGISNPNPLGVPVRPLLNPSGTPMASMPPPPPVSHLSQTNPPIPPGVAPLSAVSVPGSSVASVPTATLTQTPSSIPSSASSIPQLPGSLGPPTSSVADSTYAPSKNVNTVPSVAVGLPPKDNAPGSSVPPLMSLQVAEPSTSPRVKNEGEGGRDDVQGSVSTDNEDSMIESGERNSSNSLSSTTVVSEAGNMSLLSSHMGVIPGVYTSAREQLNTALPKAGLGITDKLPQALEKVLAFKDRRTQEVNRGVPANSFNKSNAQSMVSVEEEEEEDDDDDSSQLTPLEDENVLRKRREKNRKRKEKKKRGKQRRLKTKSATVTGGSDEAESMNNSDRKDDVEVEYVSEDPPEEIINNPALRAFRKIFERFSITEADNRAREAAATAENNPHGTMEPFGNSRFGSSAVVPHSIEDLPVKARAGFLVEENERDFGGVGGDDDEEEPPKLSKKRMKKLTRLSVAELKQLVSRPDVVEMHDVCARDPKLLINLKSYRNTVPVPRHWCAKRKYLQGKRGLEKPPFDLPDFIKATGIMEMRQAVQEKEAEKSLKNKMREKVRPKTGKIDIDYQKLHDAFFRYATKPRMTIHGDLYYEGKEFEVKLKEKKPGQLSEDLRTALGMPVGPSADRFPPPWLIAMQRYGPPPSYPNLKIPGLNAPIPDGCSFGYHAGGWGKPPVDEDGRPLYGDVFGSVLGDNDDIAVEDSGDLTDTAAGLGERHWGELESEEEESSDEEDADSGSDGDADAAAEPVSSGLVTPAEGLVTPSGVSSVGGITSTVVGLETPELIELRKKTIEDKMDGGTETPQLYKILPEVEVSVGEAFMGSSKVYEIPTGPTGTTSGSSKSSRKRRAEDMSGNASQEVGGRASTSSTQDRNIMNVERERTSAKKYKEFKF